MIYVFGGYAFVGLFVLLWTTKNIAHDLSKWLVRIVIVLLLLAWMGAST
jgi:heme A synthase